MELIEGPGFFEKVRSFLKGEISLASLDDWIVEHLPSLVPPRRDAVSDLAGRIQLWIAESDQEHRDKAEIRALIEDYLRQHETLVVFVGPVSYSASANVNVPMSISTGQQAGRVSLSLRTQP